MSGDEVLKRIAHSRIVVLPASGLAELLVSAEAVREEDTLMAGMIRILVIAKQVVVQEQTPDREKVIVRACASRDEADRFVDDRLSTYDRMWDGCGCKIDYFA